MALQSLQQGIWKLFIIIEQEGPFQKISFILVFQFQIP